MVNSSLTQIIAYTAHLSVTAIAVVDEQAADITAFEFDRA